MVFRAAPLTFWHLFFLFLQSRSGSRFVAKPRCMGWPDVRTLPLCGPIRSVANESLRNLIFLLSAPDHRAAAHGDGTTSLVGIGGTFYSQLGKRNSELRAIHSGNRGRRPKTAKPAALASNSLWNTVIRIITIEREYGCGAAGIAEKLASRLGWKLWDQLLTQEIARLAHCEKSVVEKHQERRDPLYYRLLKSFALGSYEGSSGSAPVEMLDADSIVRISERVVQQAAAEGNCIIVGRGSQHFLRSRDDTLRFFFYASKDEKVRRFVKARRKLMRKGSWIEWTMSAPLSSESTFMLSGPTVRSITR